ncbi:alpha/beta hydrolase-fold protein [Azospirillum sp. SYSU D00513]|uniref:alpha/beta hydrolase n=1 Tax=Azospirillum sp. SYSU D00513 TaxID=2812561 RepID=UPI001A96F95C|nr:alpha/beta hydrolase-fold protein [Azospirillum sp. SYSU D00513]
MARFTPFVTAVCTAAALVAASPSLAATPATPSGGAGAALPAARSGTVQELSLTSSHLADPYRYTVYLPRGYESDCLSYPVVYLLHGASGNERDWLDKGKVAPTLDRLIAEERIPPVVVVMPGHRAMWWVDGHADKAETVLLDDLLPEVEKRFRVSKEREGRVFAGLSAGGFATVRFAFTRPELFAVGLALSPAVYQPVPPQNSSAVKDPTFQKDGAFDAELWKRLNWPALVEGYKAQPLRVPLYLNSGDHDRFDIVYHAAVLYQELRRIQPGSVEYRVVDGDHEWPVWEHTIGDALGYAAKYIKGPQSAMTVAAGDTSHVPTGGSSADATVQNGASCR